MKNILARVMDVSVRGFGIVIGLGVLVGLCLFVGAIALKIAEGLLEGVLGPDITLYGVLSVLCCGFLTVFLIVLLGVLPVGLVLHKFRDPSDETAWSVILFLVVGLLSGTVIFLLVGDLYLKLLLQYK